jgi:hypothetical protein
MPTLLSSKDPRNPTPVTLPATPMSKPAILPIQTAASAAPGGNDSRT